MAVDHAYNNGQIPRGGADLWDDGLAGQILRNDFFTAAQTAEVTGTATTAQAQITAATGSSTPQAITGEASTSQAQTSAGTGSVAAMGQSGSAATSQAQTSSATGSSTPQAITGNAATSQRQTAAAAGTSTPQAITGTATTGQAQTTTATGASASAGISGAGSTSQGQSSASSGVVSGAIAEQPKGGGVPAYYLYDSEQEKRDKLAKQYPKAKKKASKAALSQEIAPETTYQSLSSELAKSTVETIGPKVDAKASRFIADQLALAESKADEQIAAAIEEEEIAIAMCLM